MNNKQKQQMQAQITPIINSEDCRVQCDFITEHGHDLLWQQYFDWLLNYAQMNRYNIDDEHWLVGTIEEAYPRITTGTKVELQNLADAYYAVTLQSLEYELYPADLGDINGVLLGEFLERVEGSEVFGTVRPYTIDHYGDFERML
ncbi:hypothetical protein ACYATO_08725 [Lactobacillaceae bacterium Melli_B3]